MLRSGESPCFAECFAGLRLLCRETPWGRYPGRVASYKRARDQECMSESVDILMDIMTLIDRASTLTPDHLPKPSACGSEP